MCAQELSGCGLMTTSPTQETATCQVHSVAHRCVEMTVAAADSSSRPEPGQLSSALSVIALTELAGFV